MPEQLQMLWPPGQAAPTVTLPQGYVLRQARAGDEARHTDLMRLAGFVDWTVDKSAGSLRNVLPDGFFLIEHSATAALVATAIAGHAPTELHPNGGELGWVAGDPAHRGKGMGFAVCAAVVLRFLSAGYRRIYLKTDDFRLPAIMTYLKLGFRPLLHQPDMAARWAAIVGQLKVTLDPR